MDKMTTSKTKKVGKYEILDVLGRGGMGIVYKAINPSIGCLVAIKMITSNYADDPGFLKRFYREAQATGNLHHPNIVIVHDLGEHEGNPFLVMEFLEGVSLDCIIREERPLPLIEKLDLIIQACNGLQYAHERDVIHRDIKPGNIMVVNQGATVKLVDFGIARIEDEANVTLPSQVMGTIQYMSPDQINGKPIDGRSDVFSMAVVLFQLLTGKLPFAGKDTGSTLLKIINEPPPQLSKYLETYPPELDAILQRGLAKSIEERYQTAEEFALDITQVQEQLRRDAVTEYLVLAEDLLARGEFGKAREQCLQITRLDRQNNRAKEILQEVQRRIKKQQRGEQAQQLLANAQAAYGAQEFDRALLYVEQAVELDSENIELQSFRDSVAEAKTRAEQRRSALKRAQSAQYAGDLTDALRAVEQALALDSADAEARALCTEITRAIEQRKRQMEIQGLIEDAQRQISSRRFTAALEALRKAQTLDPAAPVVSDLVSLASTGQEQERRRKELDRLTTGIQDTLNQDDLQRAIQLCDEALRQFPDDRSLLKLKSIADRQRQAAEKRQFIEEQISIARKLLDAKQSEEALVVLEAAVARYPNEPALISVLTIVQQTRQQEKAERSKNECIQRAKDALRRKCFDEAIGLLETGYAEFNSPELEDLLQFAKEEKVSFERRHQVDAALGEAQRLMAAEEFEQAISFLREALKEIEDEELEILLSDAERHVNEFDRRVGEAVETAERLLRVDRPEEAVRFLESQPESFARSPSFREIAGRAHDCRERLQNIVAAVERAQSFIASSNWVSSQEAIDECRRVYGDHSELSRVASLIEAGRRESATAAVNKVATDSRMLLMGRSYDSALELLDSVKPLLEFVADDLRLRYGALREEAERGLARRRQEAERTRPDSANLVPADDDTQERTVWKVPGPGGSAAEPDLLKRRDLNELEKLASDVETVVSIDELQAVSARAKVLAMRHSDDQRLQWIADSVTNTVTTRIDALTGIGTPYEAPVNRDGFADSVAPVIPDSMPVEAEEPISASSLEQLVESVADEQREAELVESPVESPDAAMVETPEIVPPPEPLAASVADEQREAEPVEPPIESRDAAGVETPAIAPPGPEPLAASVAEEPRESEPVEPSVELTDAACVESPATAPPGPEPLVEPIAEEPRESEPAEPPVESPNVAPIVESAVPSSSKKPEAIPPLPNVGAASVGVPERERSFVPAPATSLWKKLPKRGALTAGVALAAVVVAFIVWEARPSGSGKERNSAGGGTTAERPSETANDSSASGTMASGTPPAENSAPSLLPSSVYINTNLSRGATTLDGKPVGALRDGQLNLAKVPAGLHTIKISGPGASAQVAFRAVAANAPELTGPLSAQGVSALVVSQRAGQARLLCNCDDGTPIALDGHRVPPVVSGRQDLGGVAEGNHQLQIGKGDNAHEYTVSVTAQPVLNIFVDAERNLGVLVIQAGVEKATVFLDGRQSGQTGSNGVFRTTLPLKSVSVSVSKSGYSTPPAQVANVRKDGETPLNFDLRPVVQKATLVVSGGQPNAAIALDGKGIGSLDGSGKYSAEISPGNHTVEITKLGFQPKRLTKSFAAGSTERLSGNLNPLLIADSGHGAPPLPPQVPAIPPPAPPKMEQPKVEVKPPVVNPPAPPPQPAVPADQLDWQKVRSTQDLEAFLSRYPNSPLADLARERIRQQQNSSDRNGVLAVLERYAQAYQHKNTDELVAIWPTLGKPERKKIADSFKMAESIQMTLRPVGDPALSGDSAVVTCDRVETFTFQGGVKKDFSGQVTIKLRKQSGTWVIEGIS
jgi:eukaryotic-like serine/threonine-protein kinase